MATRPNARLCLPTGSTPRPVYRRAAKAIDFSSAEVFLLDEFGLLPGDAARCDEMIRRDFLDLLQVPPAAFDTLDPQAGDLAVECRRFDKSVASGGLDLTMLGLGHNGHLGLNEPGSTPDSATRIVHLEQSTVVAADRYGPSSPPVWGLTLGMKAILESAEIWLLVTGPEKQEILNRVLEGPIGPDVPASFLRTHPRAVVLADESAAACRP